MRKIIRTLLLLLIFAAIFPFTYPWKDGKPMLSWQEVKTSYLSGLSLPELPEFSPPWEESNTAEKSDEGTHQPVTFYRWRDADGGSQFSSTPPPEGVAYEVVEVHPDTNLIQGSPQQTNSADQPDNGTVEVTPSSLPSPLSVSPGEALEIIDEAKRLRELSEQRLEQHDALMQQ